MTLQTHQPDQLIKTKQVFDLTGYGRTTIYMMIKAGTFPAPVRNGATMRFSLREVTEWIERRKAQRDGTPANSGAAT